MNCRKIIVAFMALAVSASVAAARVPADPVALEANHLLDCQTKSGPAAGAINDALPLDGPRWIVPRENGTAVLGLTEAYRATGDVRFKDAALRAAEYLARRQEADGAWCEYYDEQNGSVVNRNKSVSHAGSVLMALFRIRQMGWEDGTHRYYDSARKAADYIIACIDNKPGARNGLAGAGKEYGDYPLQDGMGRYQWSGWSWVSDNCYAYIALTCMQEWASASGDAALAETCGSRAAGVLNGINAYLKNPGNAVWYRVVGSNGEPVAESDKIDALCYYPQKMDLPVPQRGREDVARWMADHLQVAQGTVGQGYGAYRWGDAFGANADRRSQGFALEAYLALLDMPGPVAQRSRQLAKDWWEADDNTGGNGQLWDTARGGIVDWYGPHDQPPVAPGWQKFIDTSSNCIFAYRGGFNHLLTENGAGPARPDVHAGDPGMIAKNMMTASWTCRDGGIAEYQYRITQDSPQGSVVRDWTSAAQATRVTAEALALVPGKTYYWSVRARNAAGVWSDAGCSGGTLYAPVDPAAAESGAAYPDLRALAVVPNPYQPGGGDARFGDTAAGPGIVFEHLTAGADITIFTLDGAQVARLRAPHDSGRCRWDARTAGGEEAASGVYVYLVTGPGGEKKTGKLAIIR